MFNHIVWYVEYYGSVLDVIRKWCHASINILPYGSISVQRWQTKAKSQLKKVQNTSRLLLYKF